MDQTNEEQRAMTFQRRICTFNALVLSALLLTAGPAGLALAQSGAPFPSRPVTLVLPFPPGGSTDIVARIIQPRLAQAIGQAIVIDNRAGAAGQIATAYVAKAEPDGHTLFLSFDTHAINPVANKNLPYDTFRDFAPVTLLVRFALVIGAHPSVKGANLKEFVDFARTQPGKMNYASTGLGSLNHLAAEELKRRAGIDVVHVPYKGGGPAIQAILANEVQYTFLSFAAQRSHIQAGKIKPLAVTGARRLPELPDVPTLAESGLPGMEAYSWIGIFAPAATPVTVVSKLHDDFVAAANDPETRGKLTGAGFEVVGSTQAELARFVRSEYERWDKFARESNIKFE
jgi:tripartite-type tricarboxylate transporter receptor subunit TctC